MKKIITSLCMLATAVISYGKAVDENTAKTVAYNFYKPKAAIQGTGDLSLAYTATSVVNGATVVDFYVFNTNSVQGFIIVSGDDNVQPVLGYSTESNFVANNINSSFQYWLNGYRSQVAYVIQHNITPTSYTVAKWDNLKSNSPVTLAGKTTTTSVSPMLTSTWDQYNEYGSTPLYNTDCPNDPNHGGLTVTGCVATAMSQVMKFWNWPDTAVGSVTYTQHPNHDNLPQQTVNFDSAYHFNLMEVPKVTQPNAYVAKLMYNAGVSVYMDYGTLSEDGSGSYVTKGYSQSTSQCAEYAMVNYWRYPSSKGYQRYNYSDAQWVDTMVNEMNSGRPVIYAGSGSVGGHCWVMDGYDNDSFFHFNWGWSGQSDCYVTINDMVPNQSGDTFNDYQEAIVRIIPDTPANTHTAAVAQVTSSANDIKVYPNPAVNTVNISLGGVTATEVVISDIEGRIMQQFIPAKGQSIITISVSNLTNGVYLVRLTTDQGIITRKFTITK